MITVQSASRSVRRNAGKKLAAQALAALGLSVLVGVPQAQAHRRDFPFTTDWRQPMAGEREIELQSRYRGRDNTFQQQVELEYGVNKRFALGSYLVFNRQPGGNLRYDEFKLEGRYQLGEFKTGTLLPGLYLEFAKPRDDKAEVEAKLILSHYTKKGEDFTFNYIIERELANGKSFENEYSFGYARDIGDKGYRGGVEWIHNLESGRINAGPTLGLPIGNKVWLVGGYAFAVNRRAGNQGEFRLLTEYEF